MPTGELQNDEQMLLAELAAGSRAAFEEIYHEYYNGLLFFAQRFLPLQQAEDVLAEVFIKLWQFTGSFSSMPALHKWLRVAVRNACLNVLTQEKRHTEKQHQLLHETEARYEHLYFRDKLEADLQALILREVHKLHPQQQRIVQMFFLQGMDNAGIAAALQISVQAVKNQKVTALKTLRKIFRDPDLFLILSFLLVT